jgi:hypothetical protein
MPHETIRKLVLESDSERIQNTLPQLKQAPPDFFGLTETR